VLVTNETPYPEGYARASRASRSVLDAAPPINFPGAADKLKYAYLPPTEGLRAKLRLTRNYPEREEPAYLAMKAEIDPRRAAPNWAWIVIFDSSTGPNAWLSWIRWTSRWPDECVRHRSPTSRSFAE
jgi:hypothetical protein